MKKFSLSTWLYFMIPSILGVILFMIPLKFGDEWKVPVAKLADILSTAIEPAMPMAAMIVIIIAAIGSVLFLFVRQNHSKPSFIITLFKVSPFWTITRVIGAIFAVMVTFQIGPEAVWNIKCQGDYSFRRMDWCHSYSPFSSLQVYCCRSC